MIQQNIDNYWKSLEKKYPTPNFVKTVKDLQFRDLKKAINNKNETYLKKIIRKMYVEGEAYILRKAAPKHLKNIMLNLAKHYKKTRKSKFYKMLNGCPNFHRVIDKKITKKYSLYAIKHSFYFYNWNIKSKLERKLKNGAYKHWRYIKFLAGNKKNSFENNLPSDGQIDRIQIVRYPAGGGQLRDHVDPRKNQRIVSGVIMGKIGKDFQKEVFILNLQKKKNLILKIDLKKEMLFCSMDQSHME